ncbi:MAG: phosphonate ABC transporter, permease protein PhnE [Thermotaleaceae bacterium]
MDSTYIALKKEKSFYTWAGAALILLTTIGTGHMSEFDLLEAIRVMPGIADFILTDFLPPAIQAMPQIISPLLDTFYMAIVSTISGALVSIFLALLGATPTMPHPIFKYFIRAFVSLLRNVPELAWTLILVPAFGIGKFVGMLALFLGSVGTMTRFFTESIEEIDLGGIEAIRSVGGSYWQTLKNGVIPQCMPRIISWTLYNMELNIRASTIIGMVGGGGIGLYIQYTIKLFRYDYAFMAILIVGMLVLGIELVSKKIREAIL